MRNVNQKLSSTVVQLVTSAMVQTREARQHRLQQKQPNREPRQHRLQQKQPNRPKVDEKETLKVNVFNISAQTLRIQTHFKGNLKRVFDLFFTVPQIRACN